MRTTQLLGSALLTFLLLIGCNDGSDGGTGGGLGGGTGGGGPTGGAGGAAGGGGTAGAGGGGAGAGVGGGGPGGAAGSSGAAWSGGPAGHVYAYAGPLYDIDATNGAILRTIKLDHPASLMQATPSAAFFGKFDAAGKGKVFSVGLSSDEATEVVHASANLRAVGGGKVLGDRNSSIVITYDPATQEATETPIPVPLQCEGRSASDSTFYLVCIQIGVAGTDIGLLAFDIATRKFSPFVVVKTGSSALALASNATYTPAGVLFSLYEGSAVTGSRTAYRIDLATSAVSAGVALPGMSDDLDSQDAIGSVVYLTEYPSDQILPVDVATLTPAAPIAIQQPMHLRAGGGALWVAMRGMDKATAGGALAKVSPASGEIAIRAFPPLEASEVATLAFGGL
jgi:hypothetical protein